MRIPKLLVGLPLCLLLGALLRLPTFTRPLLSDDEAIYAVTADAMRLGGVLYRDVVDHKPPLIYFIYRAGGALFGPFTAQGAHLFVVLAVLLTGWLLARIARAHPRAEQEVADPALGAVAAGLFLIFSTTWHDYDALAANCELFLVAAQAGAACVLLGGRAWWRQGLVGVLIGVSALCKYQGLTFLGASVGFLLLEAHAGRLRRRDVALGAALQALGAALPFVAYLALAAAQGGLDATLYWFAFNFLYVGAGLSGLEAVARAGKRIVLIGLAALPVYLGGLVGAGAIVRRWLYALARRRDSDHLARVVPPSSFERFLVLWLATAAIAWSAGGRFFGHYFHLLLPPLALLAAPRILHFLRGPRRLRALVVVTAALPALGFFLLATVLRPLHERLDEAEPPYARVAARIAAHSAPHERLFVWGNSPQLYLFARRSLGTRFSFCNYMTGESPGTRTETGELDADASSLPAAWNMLFEDLDRRRPEIFVDAAAGGWDGYDKFPVSRYPRLSAYLARHYRLVEAVRVSGDKVLGSSGDNGLPAIVIYRRKGPS